MKTSPGQRYIERAVSLPTDPLTALTALVEAGLHEQHIVYEQPRQWSYAGGVLAEISLDRSGAHLRGVTDGISLDWNDKPLLQIRQLLDSFPVPGWRAYGWAAFELAYAKDGDRSAVGEQPLLHLIIPRTEVRIDGGTAVVRATDTESLDAVTECLAAATNPPAPVAAPIDVRHGATHYQRAVADAVDAIHADRFQKVILSRTFAVNKEIDLLATYRHGRKANNPARSFLLNLGGIEATGFSPEVVVAVDADGRVISQPLAGTRALTGDPARDGHLRTELLSNPKEIYEHAISVKIAVDELVGVCTPDSLSVEEFMTVRERGTVQHLASRVGGRLADGHDAWDAFAAVFPAVTASGVPKAAAYEAIRSLEPAARGLYSGAVFSVDHNGSMDAALVLRAVYRQFGRTWLQAGAGIVGQSRPEREFEETCEKLDSVAKFLVPAAAPVAAG
ncbi:salicylate synthase [Nocardia nepalensis]|uniref:salicylate synthase n=1 Tax=Nocardia nepalensis TaxID=3375448 RepID=UPI003B66E872